MTNTLANTLPDPSSFGSIGWVLVAIVAILTGLNQTMRFIGHFRERPIPADTYVTKVQCEALHSGIDREIQRNECQVGAIRAEIKDLGIRIDTKDEERSIAIHNRINGIEALANQILGQLKGTKK